MTQPLNFGVDRGVLLDIGIRLRNVRLWLVVVVVAHEVLDRVIRKKLAKFARELSGEGLVVRHDERGALKFFDQPRRGRTLTRSCRPEENNILFSCVDARCEFLNGLWLITRRLVFGNNFERLDCTGQFGNGTHALTLALAPSRGHGVDRR